MRNFVILIVFIAAPFLASRLFRWAVQQTGDRIIDPLIKANRARLRDGMEVVDWRKVDRLGGWGEEAQKRVERETVVH